MPRNDEPSLSTIASLAKVSTGTVSRALKGHPALSTATVQRVRKIAKHIGYRQNPLVSEVMRHLRSANGRARRGNLGYLTFGPQADQWRRHLTFLGFFEGATERAEEMGFCLAEIWADEPGMKPARLRDVLLSRGIVGLVVAPTVGLPTTPKLDWGKFAAVKVGVPFSDLPLPCAMSNQYHAMQVVLEKLGALGYQRPGLVLEDHQNLKTSSMWLAPYIHHQHNLPPINRVAPLILSHWVQKDFARWFQSEKPDVVIGLRRELILWLENLGAQVVRDVGFVHLDRSTEQGSFTGIDQRPREIGAAAIDLLAGRLVANERGVPLSRRQLMIDGRWVEGSTVRSFTK